MYTLISPQAPGGMVSLLASKTRLDSQKFSRVAMAKTRQLIAESMTFFAKTFTVNSLRAPAWKNGRPQQMLPGKMVKVVVWGETTLKNKDSID